MEYVYQGTPGTHGYPILIYLIICNLIGVTTTIDTSSQQGDYCFRETFNPVCSQGEVLILHSATYGRMSRGRCIPDDYGLSQYIGCQSDVLRLADRRCSGQRSCHIPIPDHQFEATNPCNNAQLTSYLQVVHSCLTVVRGSQDACVRGDHPTITAPSTGYISSVDAQTTGCGAKTSPWTLQASPGQTIHITLVDFTYDKENLPPTGICNVYAIVKEPAVLTSETVCGGLNRESLVYQSAGNTIEVQVSTLQQGAFLLQYSFVGCADPRPIQGMTFTRSGNKGQWQCDNNPRTWTMSCDDSIWIGRPGNCTGGSAPTPTIKPAVGSSTLDDTLTHSPSHFSWEMILILVAIVTVGMVTCVLIVSIVCLKRSRARAGAVAMPQYAPCGLYDIYGMRPLARQPSLRGTYAHPEDFYQSLPKDYTTKPPTVEDTLSRDGRYHRPIWERPLPQTPLHEEFDA